MLTGAIRLPAINKDLALRTNECRADAKPPEVEAKSGVCLAGGGESVVAYKWQLAQHAESAEARRQRQVGQQHQDQQREEWDEDYRSQRIEPQLVKYPLQEVVDQVDQQQRYGQHHCRDSEPGRCLQGQLPNIHLWIRDIRYRKLLDVDRHTSGVDPPRQPDCQPQRPNTSEQDDVNDVEARQMPPHGVVDSKIAGRVNDWYGARRRR